MVWIQQQWKTVLATAGAVGTIVSLLYNQVYKKAKEKTEQLAASQVTAVQQSATQQINAANTKASTATLQTIEVQKQYDELKQASENVIELQNTIEAQKIEIQTVTAEKNQIERMFQQKYFPEPVEPTVK